MKQFTSRTQKIGELGEDIAVRFLVKQGFKILERNYTLKTGEIDIVTTNNDQLVFWEVKTIQCSMGNVSRGTYNPFTNINDKKLKRFVKTVEHYLYSHNVPHETSFCIHAAAVFLDLSKREAKVEIMENIV